MPYKSDAQRRFFHSPGAKKAGITGKEVDEFDQASKGLKLPETHKKKMAYGGETNPKKETLSAMQNNPTAGFAQGGEVMNPDEQKNMKDDNHSTPMNPIRGDWESIKKSLIDTGNRVHENYIKGMGDYGKLKGVENVMKKKEYAEGGEVKEDKTWLERLSEQLASKHSSITSGKSDAEIAAHIDDPVGTSTDTAKGYAAGGEVPSDMNPSDMVAYMLSMGTPPPAQPTMPMNPWMQGAAEKASAPLTPQPWMQPPQPAPDQNFINQLNAGIDTNPAPQNPISATMGKLGATPNTPPGIYQGMTAADRAALMQKLIAQKNSPGMLIAKGAAGLGDAITSAFGKSPTQNLQGLRDTENKNIEQRIGVMDTERQQKLQDLEAQQSQSLNDPNSTLSQGMRKILNSAGLKVPSGMSGAIMLKVAGPLGELAMKQATLAETAEYHRGELGSQAATRNLKEEEYKSEHPFLNWLNPVGNENPATPVSNPNAPGHVTSGHGVPDLGSTFNGEKVIGVRRIK